MLCPRCGSRQPLGTARCAVCGTPFTRREAARRPPSARPAVATAPSQTYRAERRTSARRSAVAWIFVLGLVIVAVVALAAFFSSNVVKPYVDRSVNNSVNAPAPTTVVTVPPVANSAGGQATTTSGGLQMVITEQDINNQIAKNAGSFGPVSDVKVKIATDQFIVNFKAYGLSGQYSGRVAMQNGEPVLTNGKVTGTLGMFVSTSTVENALNQQIAAAVAKAGVQVNSVALRPGQMVLSINS